MRVVIIKDFVQSNFPATPLLNYAMEVEKITTSKVSALHKHHHPLLSPLSVKNPRVYSTLVLTALGMLALISTYTTFSET